MNAPFPSPCNYCLATIGAPLLPASTWNHCRTGINAILSILCIHANSPVSPNWVRVRGRCLLPCLCGLPSLHVGRLDLDAELRPA